MKDGFEDYGQGEAEALEHVRGGDLSAKAVEEEGRGGSFDVVGCEALRGDQGGI